MKVCMMHNISNKCANCGACYNVCPLDAIRVEDGAFYTPVVDETKCVNCGKCVTVCPVNTFDKAQNITTAYAAEHKSKDVIAASSSGGAFTALAEYVLEQGGVVWGAGYADNYNTVIFQSTNTVSLDKLRRSKYVESLVGDSFKEIKKLLDAGQTVLFCGTPCQAAGLKRFIGEHENLYIVDFSCGGLVSHQLYAEWLCSLKNAYKSEITDVNFRSKYFGWGVHGVCVKFENGKKYLKPAVHDPYFASYLNGKLSLREYCYQCQFSDNHYSDLILADYWKYYETYPRKNHTGISLILVNSLKGEFLMQKIADKMQVRGLPLDKACYNIKETHTTDALMHKRTRFLETVERVGLHSAAKQFCLPSGTEKIIYGARVYIKKAVLWLKGFVYK